MKKQPMKIKCFPLVAMLATFIFAACGNDQPTKTTVATPQPDSLPQTNSIQIPPNAVLLDGLYATSTAPGQDLSRLFDGDDATGWRTLPGAGPDEGLMLYFSNTTGQRVKFLETSALAGSAFGPEAVVQVYVNGQPVAGGKPGERITLQNESGGGLMVNSLFIRFEDTGRETTAERTAGEDKIIIKSFPQDAYVGLQALRLFNDQNEALVLVPPRRVPGNVTASSTLAPESAYSADDLFDARKEFVWVEGNAAGEGAGETVTFTFGQPVHITALQIWNGYQRSPEHYTANARVKGFSFGAQGGPAGNFTLRDDRAGQKIDLPAAASGQVFELKISSIFPGKKYKDLAISDIVFYDGAAPFILKSEQAAGHQSTLRARTAASPLAALLDRRVYNLISAQFAGTAQSLILRADGTFVLYTAEESFGDESSNTQTASQIIADGNWELLESNSSTAKVKVFGKWFDYSEVIEYYKGPTNREVIKIFSDVLTIDARTIRGTKMIGTFYRN